MPRRQFISHLHDAAKDTLPSGVDKIQQSDDDGQFDIYFNLQTLEGLTTVEQVSVLVPNLDEYPTNHDYMIFTTDDASPQVISALQLVHRTKGKTVAQVISLIATTVGRLALDRDGDTQMEDTQYANTDDEIDDDDLVGIGSDGEHVYDSDHDAFNLGNHGKTSDQPSSPHRMKKNGISSAETASRARIQSDLLDVKKAGFRVGMLGHIVEGPNCIVTVSIRIAKLGISEEAMEAWQVDPNDYLILMIQYSDGYRPMKDILGIDSGRLAGSLRMRVVASRNYKPSRNEANKAFSMTGKTKPYVSPLDGSPTAFEETAPFTIKDTFISKPLEDLLQARLVPILRFRATGMEWHGAEKWYNERTTSAYVGGSENAPESFYLPEPINSALPSRVTADHFKERSIGHSFPLVAMQFLLRHFVRCTEFCLICHRQMGTELEAIKPYVCDSGLCLYQYMSLGFGPSIEHEIIAQPYVVDLLVSFLYNSAVTRKLKEFPDGLAISVPPMDFASEPLATTKTTTKIREFFQRPPEPNSLPRCEPNSLPRYEVGLDISKKEIIFFKKPDRCPVKRGDWIVIKSTDILGGTELHCRVSEAVFYPTIRIDDPVMVNVQGQLNTSTPEKTKATDNILVADSSTTPKWTPATFQVYSEDFESLDTDSKGLAISRILDTLPDVTTMRAYLLKSRPADLRSWVERISPSALSILRWCIASNRACIMQVDGETDGGLGSAGRQQERLFGMKDYMQFRFAMGAPDKEQRFINEVQTTSMRRKTPHPTIFAWHGSPLYNWHMIIREGLHYKNTLHGRAYGHGVYHAKEAGVSTGYSGMNGGYAYGGGGRAPGTWGNSVLRISTALALNEIVNAPDEFVSSSPYLVVQHLDWIQTRYLLVQVNPTIETLQVGMDRKPTKPFAQDPLHIPKGTSGPIEIPASAIRRRNPPKKRSHADNSGRPKAPKKRRLSRSFTNPFPLDSEDDDGASTSSNLSDQDFLCGNDEEPGHRPLKNQKQKLFHDTLQTDFRPGTLDFSVLPLLPMPTYAVSGTTKRLMKDLQAVQKAQEVTPLAELGWYIDTNKLENVYQWIVELHSFHNFEVNGKKLPLAEDMKKKGTKSIVLEMRFNKDFPYSPPYVRVLRPRFLSLNQGGGGHIVLGGAMCMELLTNTGWSSVSSMESVLMQIRLAIASEPFARLDMRQNGDYGAGEAADGYLRACRAHGWAVPEGFTEMAYLSGSPGNKP